MTHIHGFWSRYKWIEELDDDEKIRLELRDACSPEVNQLLYDFVGPHTLNDATLTEAILLAHVKSVSVKSIHVEVHRWTFANMKQEEGECITKFVGRLKAQASLCKFEMACQCGCGHTTMYSYEMISQQIVKGLANPEHQARMLNEASQLETLQSKVDRLISLETTVDATMQITQ